MMRMRGWWRRMGWCVGQLTGAQLSHTGSTLQIDLHCCTAVLLRVSNCGGAGGLCGLETRC